MQKIYFAGGCFWGWKNNFSRIPGVCDTECGYANGAVENPTYEEVCSDTTGFAETVCILYNPDIVALRILVRQFFKIIDPVSINRQGNDRGSQYRTGIYYISDEDLGPIQSVMFEIQKDCSQPLAVELEPLRNFYRLRITTRTICKIIPTVTAILISAVSRTSLSVRTAERA